MPDNFLSPDAQSCAVKLLPVIFLKNICEKMTQHFLPAEK